MDDRRAGASGSEEVWRRAGPRCGPSPSDCRPVIRSGFSSLANPEPKPSSLYPPSPVPAPLLQDQETPLVVSAPPCLAPSCYPHRAASLPPCRPRRRRRGRQSSVTTKPREPVSSSLPPFLPSLPVLFLILLVVHLLLGFAYRKLYCKPGRFQLQGNIERFGVRTIPHRFSVRVLSRFIL